MRSSMGPKGMDKMLQSPDGDIVISARVSPHTIILISLLPGRPYVISKLPAFSALHMHLASACVVPL